MGNGCARNASSDMPPSRASNTSLTSSRVSSCTSPPFVSYRVVYVAEPYQGGGVSRLHPIRLILREPFVNPRYRAAGEFRRPRDRNEVILGFDRDVGGYPRFTSHDGRRIDRVTGVWVYGH